MPLTNAMIIEEGRVYGRWRLKSNRVLTDGCASPLVPKVVGPDAVIPASETKNLYASRWPGSEQRPSRAPASKWRASFRSTILQEGIRRLNDLRSLDLDHRPPNEMP